MPNYSQDYLGKQLRRGSTGRGGWSKPDPNNQKAKMVGSPNIFEDNSEFMAPLKKKAKEPRQ